MVRPRASLLTALALVPAVFVPTGARGQNLSQSLTVTGFPQSAAPTGGDFLNGFVDVGPATFEVATTGGSPNAWRTTTVSIRCALPCPASGSKPISQVFWRRADQAGWTQLTTGDVQVEQRSMQRNGVNDPWGNSLLFRFLLSWAGDPAGTAGSYQVVLTLSVTSP